MSIEHVALLGQIQDTDSGARCQTPRVSTGRLMYDFDGKTHQVHSVLVRAFSSHPHAIARCGANYTVGGSTMATDPAPDGNPTCDRCLSVEGAPDVLREMNVGRIASASQRSFEAKLLSEVIFKDGGVAAIRPLNQRT